MSRTSAVLPAGQPGKRATLKDVATVAGVSPMTVSNVVNGTLRGYNDETRDRVLAAVSRVNYRPHIGARSMRTDRRMAVGMLVSQTGRRFLSDPYITQLLDGLCSGLNQRGYSLVLQSMSPSEVWSSSLIHHLQTDGLCILMADDFVADPRFPATIRLLSQPIVLFQQVLPKGFEDLCAIRQDDHEGARVLAEHLVARGARNLLMLVPQVDWPAFRARIAGVRQFLATTGVKTKLTVLASTDESPTATHAALEAFLSSGGTPDAVLAGNDQIAIAAYRLLAERGFRVPEDVKLTGFNGFEFLDYFGTRLTTVRSPAFELGQLGAYHMVKRIETGRFDSDSIVLPTEPAFGSTT